MLHSSKRELSYEMRELYRFMLRKRFSTKICFPRKHLDSNHDVRIPNKNLREKKNPITRFRLTLSLTPTRTPAYTPTYTDQVRRKLSATTLDDGRNIAGGIARGKQRNNATDETRTKSLDRVQGIIDNRKRRLIFGRSIFADLRSHQT